MCALRISKPQSLLACQYALDPAPLIGPWWLEGRKRLREPPKAGILADVIFDEKALKRLTSSIGQEQHRLMGAVEHRLRPRPTSRHRSVGDDPRKPFRVPPPA